MDLGHPIAKGNTAEIYLYEGKIIKVFHDQLPESKAKYEAEKQEKAFLHGLPVPRIFDITCINGKQAIIMEHIEGAAIGDLMQQDKDHAGSYLAHSVDIQIEMHAKAITDLESMRDFLRQKLQNARALSDTNRQSLLARLSEMPMEKKLCHGDFHAFNLIKNVSKTFIIDWVDSCSGSPCADAYRSYLLYSQSSSLLAESYLRLYCEKSGFTRGDILIWAPVVAGARLSENVSSEEAERLRRIVPQNV